MLLNVSFFSKSLARSVDDKISSLLNVKFPVMISCYIKIQMSYE